MLKLTSRVPVAVAAIAVAAVLAACGSSSPNTPNSTSAAATTPTLSGAFAYAHCMRSHGVTGFPDPTSSGANSKQAVISALQQVGNSRSQAAQTACMHVNGGSPGTGGPDAAPSQARTGAFLAFARCMRHRGLTNFPDPTTSGQLTHQMLANAGVNLHQPAVVHDADACVSVTHGMITKATVARFAAGQ
jgi:hypothetical protein